ncbi:MAG TPA: HAMP domain-containing sensor histidine kinase, partial [Anaerolineae bacterium]
KDTVDFEYDSPFAHYLRLNPRPLVQYDIDTVGTFARLSESEKTLLNKLRRVLFMPLHAGNSLVGVLALGAKYTGESYDRRDFELLQSLSNQISPLLAQSQNLASLRQINNYVFRQNQMLAREKQHLRELSALYAQFIELVSPDLRRPFTVISKQMQQLEEKTGEIDPNQFINELNHQLVDIKTPIDNLITMAARIQMRSNFNFGAVHLHEITTTAIRNLRTMAEARRVKVEFSPDRTLPAVLGDEQQLLEAVQHLLHNAIKFNKIGGIVQIDCGVDGDDMYLRVVDTGVGIPDERLDQIWTGFKGLSRNGSKRGSGLGLALTRFIVSAHGGYVKAESKYGSGSVFSIHLPLVFED